MARLGTDNLFDDFAVGDRFRHFRGKTLTNMEIHTLSQLVMNTSEGHFNEVAMQDSPFGSVVMFGGIVAAIVWGIASQDTAEHAIDELAVERLVLRSPARAGDTLFAETTVLECEAGPGDDATGVILFRHVGINQRGDVVCEMDRRVRLRRRPLDDA